MATFANLLELNVCESRINDNHLVGVLRICKTLPILNVSGCTGITDFGFKKAFLNEGLFSSTFPIVHFTCNRAVDKPHHRNLGTNASKHCTVNSILKCTRCTCYSYLVHSVHWNTNNIALRCLNAPSPVHCECTVLLFGMAVLDMPLRQSKKHSFCTVLVQKYFLVIVHLEKTFSSNR